DLLSDSLRDGGRRVDPAETREAEDILDEMVQPRRLSIDMAERPIAFGVGLRAAEAEGLEIELDLGERRAELVRHARHEIGAQPCQVAFAAQLRDGDDGERCGQAQYAEQNRQS